MPSNGVRDEQLAAAVELKPRFDSKTLGKFYLQPALTPTPKTHKHFEASRPPRKATPRPANPSLANGS
jgi:hypothetical protein